MRWLFAIAATLASGCFYLDPINERPSAEIHRDNPEVPLIRGGTDPMKDSAVVSAVWSDPNNDAVDITWAAYGCAADGKSCSAIPFATGTESSFQIDVPQADYIATVLVSLDVKDSHGAIARPGQTLVLNVTDRDPLLNLFVDGTKWPVHLPIRVRADVSDPDGDAVTLAWDPPFAMGTDTQKSAWTIISDTERRFTPDVAGDWTVRVVADDGKGGTAEKPKSFHVDDDQPPCLGLSDPALDTILDRATRFTVRTVDDDLNAYPTPALGPIGFHWSIRSPHTNGAWQVIDTDESSVVIDPDLGGYAKGDAIDLRVEITDDTPRPLPCDDSIAQCSINADSCMQRQTWNMVVR